MQSTTPTTPPLTTPPAMPLPTLPAPTEREEIATKGAEITTEESINEFEEETTDSDQATPGGRTSPGNSGGWAYGNFIDVVELGTARLQYARARGG